VKLAAPLPDERKAEAAALTVVVLFAQSAHAKRRCRAGGQRLICICTLRYERWAKTNPHLARSKTDVVHGAQTCLRVVRALPPTAFAWLPLSGSGRVRRQWRHRRLDRFGPQRYRSLDPGTCRFPRRCLQRRRSWQAPTRSSHATGVRFPSFSERSAQIPRSAAWSRPDGELTAS
jgi:hypothetical protein